MKIRTGTIADLNIVLALMDEAVAWLAAQGRTDQWGSEPFSANPKTTAFIRKLVEAGDLFIAEIDGEAAGALIVNEAPMPYVPPVEERELYVRLLVASRRFKGQGIGAKLVEFARDEARKRGIDLLRVDCYSGPDEKLVRFYESVGFTRTERINVRDGIHVQVLEDRISTP
jgi:GNAT superfamily N-acetyltransferase